MPSNANRKFKVMIRGCICWNGVGTLAKVTGNINSEKYKEIIEETIKLVIVRHFPDDYYFLRITMPQCIDLGYCRSTGSLTIKNPFLGLPNHLISIKMKISGFISKENLLIDTML